MKIRYIATIKDPTTHIVNVKLKLDEIKASMTFYLPSWSPGSYLMREYARNIRTIQARNEKGQVLNLIQTTKSEYSLELGREKPSEIELEYNIYCHELTVRTSHVDESHAFLHGPSYLMAISGQEKNEHEIEFRFPALWSKITTGLKETSRKREEFIYLASSYDELVDSPVEIGCQETDGFMYDGKEHYLAFYGKTYPHKNDLKDDIKKIVETVGSHFSSIPYDSYHIITHFGRGLFGGLEHLNSTALQFDGRKLAERESYVNWLALVAHEYFHTWNVKRIRPIELGLFDYQNENYTRMHWLTEGLTSFMDELFVLRSGLCSPEEYLKMQRNNLARYFSIPGRKFHTLEDSSFNAWIKLYRPDENSNNSSISYYLKGGLVFSTLHFEFVKLGKNINDLLTMLWDRYITNPKVGVTKEEVLEMIESISNKEVRERFDLLISTTEEIDFESYYNDLGCEFIWKEAETFDLGAELSFDNSRVIIAKVAQDQAAFKSGLNAGDEILAINGVRFLKEDVSLMNTTFLINKNYEFLISRLGEIKIVTVLTQKGVRLLESIQIKDMDLFKKTFL